MSLSELQVLVTRYGKVKLLQFELLNSLVSCPVCDSSCSTVQQLFVPCSRSAGLCSRKAVTCAERSSKTSMFLRSTLARQPHIPMYRHKLLNVLLVTIRMVPTLCSLKDTLFMISRNYSKCGLSRPQHTFLICISSFADIWLRFCMLESCD